MIDLREVFGLAGMPVVVALIRAFRGLAPNKAYLPLVALACGVGR